MIAMVAAYSMDGPLFGTTPVAEVPSGADGKFEMRLVAGHPYSLMATSSAEPSRPAFLVLDRVTGDVAADLKAPTGSERLVSGTVTTSNGAVAANALVQAYPYGRRNYEIYTVRTDDHGRFAFFLDGDRHMIVASASYASAAVVRIAEGTAAVPGNKIKLRPPPAPVPAAAAADIGAVAHALTLSDHGADEAVQADPELCRARIVGVGEAAHGGREFTQLRRALFSALVNKCGYRVLLLETDTEAGIAMDDFIHGKGEKSASQVTALTGSWIFLHKDFIDWLEALRVANADGSTDIRIVGIDPNFSAPAAKALLAYVGEKDNALRTRLKSELAGLLTSTAPQTYASLEEGARSKARAAIGELDRYVSMHKREVPEAQQLTLALHLLALDGLEKRYSTGPADVLVVREATMDRIARWSVDKLVPNGKALLSAHNGHVVYVRSVWKTSTLGDLLHDALGNKYIAIGLFFGHGSFTATPQSSTNAFALMKYDVQSPLPNSIESVLARVGPKNFIFNPRATSLADDTRRWLESDTNRREIGNMYSSDEAMVSQSSPAIESDRVIYLDTISALR